MHQKEQKHRYEDNLVIKDKLHCSENSNSDIIEIAAGLHEKNYITPLQQAYSQIFVP